MNRNAPLLPIALGLVVTLLLVPFEPAFADRLLPDADAPMVVHWAASLLLYSHIGGGMLGLLAGFVATISRKGLPVHRYAGQVFLVAMGLSFAIGGAVAPFLDEGQRPNFVAAVLSLYLLLSGYAAAKRRNFQIRWPERLGLVVSLSVVSMGVAFMMMAARDPSGTVDGSPSQAFLLFVVMGSLAAIGEIRLLVRKKLAQVQRIRRHLWRMCFAFFIASGSLFFGQPQVFSDTFNTTWWPTLLGFYPLLVAGLFMLLSLSRRKRRNLNAPPTESLSGVQDDAI